MKFDREKHCFVAVDPTTREQLFVPLSELGQMVVKEVERVEITAPPADLGPLRREMAEKMAAVFAAMKQEFEARLAAMREEFDRVVVVEHQRAIEALTVHSALAEGRAIEPGNFPALERLLAEAGQTVTSDAIVAAADAQARRGVEMAAGRQ